MIALRVLLGLSCTAVAAGWLLLMAIGKGLQSWGRAGSGRKDAIGNAVIIAVPVLSLAMLVTVFTPEARVLLHAVAAPVGAAFLAMGWVATQSKGTAAIGAAFFGLWLVYYGLAVWQ